MSSSNFCVANRLACVSESLFLSCGFYELKFYELLTNFKVFPKGCISCFTGLLPHHPVVDLHPPDDILPLSNAATALHLCPLRRGNCLTHQWNALHRLPSDVPPDPPDIEALLLQEDDPLPPRHLHPDTGGAPCCHLGGEAEMLDPLLRHPDASPHPLRTAVTLLEDPQPPHGAMKPWAHLRLTSADSSRLHTIKSSAEFHAPQNAVTTRGRDHLCIRQNSVLNSVYLCHLSDVTCVISLRPSPSPQPIRRASSRSVSPEPAAQKRPTQASASPSPSRSASASPPPAKKASSGSGSRSPSKVWAYSQI